MNTKYHTTQEYGVICVFKQYITQTAAFIIKAIVEQISVVVNCSTRRVMSSVIASTHHFPESFFSYKGDTGKTWRTKSQCVKSGVKGGHSILPRKEIICPGNVSPRFLKSLV